MIGRLHHLIIDCPDPRGLADFYSRLLGEPVTFAEDDFVVVSRDGRTSGLAFQLSTDLVPPTWPHPAVPQQMHLDVMVDDLDKAEAAVLSLGARRLSEAGAGSRVFADPAGHPFCLIPRPSWADPVGPATP